LDIACFAVTLSMHTSYSVPAHLQSEEDLCRQLALAEQAPLMLALGQIAAQPQRRQRPLAGVAALPPAEACGKHG
jgi:hypothetical protein